MDIIARKRSDLYFVEVKTRTGLEFGHPFESITYRKRAQLIRIAKYFLLRYGKEVGCHFGAIGITIDGGSEKIEFLPDAFLGE
jgi:putative endonuclease